MKYFLVQIVECVQSNDHIGCQNSDSASSSNFHHWHFLALFLALVLN